MKAGTQRSVTAETAPSAPSETRAARRSSPSTAGRPSPPVPLISIASPPAVTSRTELTCDEMFAKPPPVPWVAVEMAPAIVCASTSPWFSSARPRSASAGPSSRIVMPASTVTSLPSTRSTRFMRDRSSISPSVQAMSVNEWPAPTTFTRRAPATSRASSSSLEGRSTRSGAQRWSPVQFFQTPLVRGGKLNGTARARPSRALAHYDAADSAAASTRSGSGAQCDSASTGVSRRYASASSAAMQPVPAAVTACR